MSDNKALEHLILVLREWDGSNLGPGFFDVLIPLQGQTNYNAYISVGGKSSFTVGQDFKIEAVLTDTAGNKNSLISTAVYTVQ